MIDFIANLLRSTDTLPQANPEATVAEAGLVDVLWSGPASLETSIFAGYAQHAWLIVGTLAFAVALAAFVRLPIRGDYRSFRQFGLVALAAAVSFASVGSLIGASLRNLHIQSHGIYAVTINRIVHFDPVDGRTDFPASAISRVRQDRKGRFVVTLSDGKSLALESLDAPKLKAALDFMVQAEVRETAPFQAVLG